MFNITFPRSCRISFFWKDNIPQPISEHCANVVVFIKNDWFKSQLVSCFLEYRMTRVIWEYFLIFTPAVIFIELHDFVFFSSSPYKHNHVSVHHFFAPTPERGINRSSTAKADDDTKNGALTAPPPRANLCLVVNFPRNVFYDYLIPGVLSHSLKSNDICHGEPTKNGCRSF